MTEIFDYLPAMWPAYVAYLVAVISPGPAIFAIIGTAMSQGRRAGLIIALGIFGGSATWATAAALGVAAILRHHAFALEILKIAGGLYLLYLGWKAFRSARMKDADLPLAQRDATSTARRLLLRGYAIHVTNPKAIFAWLAIISLGLPEAAPASAIAAIIGLCLTSGLLIFSGYALLFSAPRALRIYQFARRRIEGAMSAFYCFAGLKLLTSRL
ncbi:threonine/homoserine/homoserine lactone efflux protein [Pseudorhizobium tarimense]|uniref:Threonine/homoserine/homoserine lactone efflux protein n=1 Tax=Pseudorhizobium tarimense TaxID=1079109 RepID=A0ABV2H919_9HYPH|nr:LysE family translocator [Pseudorhizobium tarimense]MCJ8519891.1 LysE family translocator [Pseudorhizobium tarimense]